MNVIGNEVLADMLALSRPWVGQNMVKLALRFIRVMAEAHTPTADNCIARARSMGSLREVGTYQGKYMKYTVEIQLKRVEHRRL
jgi:hypothetical protein